MTTEVVVPRLEPVSLRSNCVTGTTRRSQRLVARDSTRLYPIAESLSAPANMSLGYEWKGKAKKAIAKMLDIDTPPSPQSPPETGLRPVPSVSSSEQGLTHAFNNLSMSAPSQSFVGGFHPVGAPSGNAGPPAMPMPMYAYTGSPPSPSRTMQYATGFLDPPSALRPASALSLPPPTPHRYSDSASDITPLSAPSVKLPPLKKPVRQRSASTPPSPTLASASDPNQCCGITQAGKRCARKVIKAQPAYSLIFDDKDGPVEKFCAQHNRQMSSNSGYMARIPSNQQTEYVKFTDWIPNYLQQETRMALQVEMEKIRSKADKQGYIYTFEIRDPNEPTKLFLKVGRTINVTKRLQQWGHQCGSKDQVLHGWYPGEVEDEDGSDQRPQSMMRGKIKAGGRTVWCFRLERLIHLELADLAVNKPYLAPGWKPFIKGPGRHTTQGPEATADSPTGTPKKGKGGAKGMGNASSGPCKDCGQVHKEIFSFDRFRSGPYKGREWEMMVKTVIEGWGTFVEKYV